MRVARVEIFGFKSFMDRTILPLEAGITGVVGPNGCGKSNIIDALRWVLGETRASSLRGGVLEDVIFNGTDKLRPLGLAEVSIVLRSSGENFFADLLTPQAQSELLSLEAEDAQLGAEAEESAGESEGAVGDESPEAAGVRTEERGRPKLTVISGSKDAPQDAAEPQPERSAAGPAQASPMLLSRFSWLRGVSEVQITRRLYRSGESEFFINRVPCRLKDIRDLLRAVGLGPRSYTIVAQGEVGRIITARPEERRTILEEAAGVLGFRDRIAATSRRLDETQQNITRLNDIVAEVSRQVASLKRQANRALARRELKERIAALDRVVYRERLREFTARGRELAARSEALTERERETEQDLSRSLAEEEAARSTLFALDIEGDRLRAAVDAAREEISNRERERMKQNARLSELRAVVSSLDRERTSVLGRRDELLARGEESSLEIARLSDALAALSAEIESLQTGARDELAARESELAAARTALVEAERRGRVLEQELAALESSRAAVREQIVASSPISQLQKTLDEHKATILRDIGSGTMLVAEALRVPGEHARAVQAVLAERAAFLVVDDPFALARRFDAEIASGMDAQVACGLGALRRGGEPPASDAGPAGFPTLLSLLEVEPGCERAAAALLGGVHLAPDLGSAIRFLEERGDSLDPRFTLVTPAGDILTPVSYFTFRHEGGLIQLKRREAELSQRIEAAEAVLAAHGATLDEAAGRVTRCEELRREAQGRFEERETRVRALLSERGSVSGQLESQRKTVARIESDLAALARSLAEIVSKHEHTERAVNELAAAVAGEISEEERALRADLEQLNAEYAALEPGRKEGREKLSALAQRAAESRRALDAAREELSDASLDEQRLSLELANLNERVGAEYGASFCEELIAELASSDPLPTEEREAAADEAAKLRARVVREGDVDPTSIEQYETEKVRLDDLTAQLGDLKEAETTLRRSMEHLRKTSQERFLETFGAVAANFSKLVPRLFGGGRGALELTDPDHPLESGVEIVARPPGKKLKSLELLSGGERAMCATGLLFAMFLVRPSPLCVLDEVDAPLDDANLVRFLSLIREMSARTQFMIVTHNKQSMAVADNLVGVTMQEPGASTVVTVSLQEAAAHVG